MRKIAAMTAVAALAVATPAMGDEVTPAPLETGASAPVGAAPAAPEPIAPITRPAAPTARSASVATIHHRVVARRAPRNAAPQAMVLAPVAPFGGGMVRLLVTGSVVREGELWVRVLLPRRPNGSTGWIRGDDVSLSTARYRVEVSLSARRLRVFRDGKRVMQVPVAVGKNGTPTPTGRFAVAERVRTNTPGAFLGPVVLPLTGFSQTLNEFAGGDGRVALHGTSLPALIGTRASNGCVRLRNADVVRLERMATPGTPVHIRR